MSLTSFGDGAGICMCVSDTCIVCACTIGPAPAPSSIGEPGEAGVWGAIIPIGIGFGG
jgi:hypothetical protein